MDSNYLTPGIYWCFMGLAVFGSDLLLYIVSVSYGQLFFFTFSRVD